MEKSEKPSFLTTASYMLFSRVASRFTFPALKEDYQKSGISRLYESYLALMFFTSLITWISGFIIGALIHQLFFQLEFFRYLIAVLSFTSIITLVIPALFIVYPLYRKGQSKKQIDANLVYTTGYMGVLSAGGISTERMFERVIQVEQCPVIRELAKQLVTNIKMFGLDISSSLEGVALVSPSETFSMLLIGITNTVKTSGDLKGLFSFETKRLLHTKREQLKKTLNTLLSLGEIYIATMVMGPIVFIVMITILSIMGNATFGLTPVEQLNLLVFLGLPAISTIFIILLNGILPEEE